MAWHFSTDCKKEKEKDRARERARETGRYGGQEREGERKGVRKEIEKHIWTPRFSKTEMRLLLTVYRHRKSFHLPSSPIRPIMHFAAGSKTIGCGGGNPTSLGSFGAGSPSGKEVGERGERKKEVMREQERRERESEKGGVID